MDVHHISLPPLRERLDDLPLLVDHFLTEAAKSLAKKKPTVPPELYSLLATYHFPGNIRELRSMVFKAVSIHIAKVLSLDSFRTHIRDNRGAKAQKTVSAAPSSYPSWLLDPPADSFPTLKQAQKMLIQMAMNRAGNSQSVAAHLLGITPQALSKRLKKIGE